MHLEILDKDQLEISPFLKKYRKKFYLVGGTAVAFHIGHRRSIDFDLFTFEKNNITAIKKIVSGAGLRVSTLHASSDQIHFIINNVKLTFFEYLFVIEANNNVNDFYRIPDLLTLAAIKAFALGGRGKWKDYVDLYFIIKNHFSVSEISAKAGSLFNEVFNAGLFTKQLSFFDDINYSEPVVFMPGFEISGEEVKTFLTDATSPQTPLQEKELRTLHHKGFDRI